MLSRDGKCYTFDSRANGYVRGEGVAAVILKRHSEQQQEAVPEYLAHAAAPLGLILGSAVNHEGRSAGLTVPSAHAQVCLSFCLYWLTMCCVWCI